MSTALSDGDSSPSQSHRTFLFTWNPSKWDWPDFPEAVYETNVEGGYRGSWSCGVRRDIAIGDRAFLMRLGVEPKGITGSGLIVSEPTLGPHWDPERASKGDTVYRVDILFDVLSNVPILDTQFLSDNLPYHDWFPRASGTQIPHEIATVLELEWSRNTGITLLPLDSAEIATLHFEGVKRNRFVTTYERDSRAREKCIRHHGTACLVCNLRFEERYGSIGEGFIIVHHLTPISTIGKEYQVDPINDLRPVCPNCHAMLHTRTPPLSIDELKAIMVEV